MNTTNNTHTVTVSAPEAAKTTVMAVSQETNVSLDFDPAQAVIMIVDNNLVFRFSNAGCVVLRDFLDFTP